MPLGLFLTPEDSASPVHTARLLMLPIQDFTGINDPEEYAQIILPLLTIEEKVNLLAGVDLWRTYEISRLGISQIKTSDGPVGIRGGLFNDGITAALLPSGVSLAATWDTAVIENVCNVLIDEAKSKEVDLVLGPTVCIPRTPLGGRNYETYSEDPFLTAKLASTYINTLQSANVGACIKHFAANDQETNRFVVDETIEERALREIHLQPFQMAIKESNPWSVMTAYNKINGIHCSAHCHLLQDILRGEWSWDGLVMSDWFGTNTIVPSVNAGMDLEMPGPSRRRGQNLLDAYREGHITEDSIEKCAARVLKLLHKTGKTKRPLWQEGKEQANDRPEHREVLRSAAADGIVLLKNMDNILPIDLKKHKRIAFLGPNAGVSIANGGGSAALAAHYVTTPLDSFKKAVESHPTITVAHAQGIYTNRYIPLLDIDRVKDPLTGTPGFSLEFWNNMTHSGEVIFTEHHNTSLIMCYDNLPKILTTGERYSYRARATLTPITTGRHTLSLSSCGPGRLSLDGKVLLDIERFPWSPKSSLFMSYGSPEELVQVDMVGGQEYDLVLESISRQPAIQDIDYFGNIKREEVMDGGRIGFREEINEETLFSEALDLAHNSDLCIVVVGKNSEWETETTDMESMDLPGESNRFIGEVLNANKNTIVVNQTGSPITMPWIDIAPTVIQAWYQGQEQGNALADVLLGHINPSGKLPVTFPVRIQDNPTFYNHPGGNEHVLYGEGIFVGYRHYDMVETNPLFPFGFGLSYTSFSYDKIQLSADMLDSQNDSIQVSVNITNTGIRPGKEIVQFYVEQVTKPGLIRPKRELKGWDKVKAEPGQSVEARITLDKRSFAYWDDAVHKWVIDSGAEFMVVVGRHSRDRSLQASLQVAHSAKVIEGRLIGRWEWVN